MRPDISDIRLCGEAFRPSAMGGGTFIVALLGLGWLVIVAAFAG
jgi:hypothetical protein